MDATGRPQVGVFGGAFDPPHLAHQCLVRTAMLELALDRLLVVPTGQAWHKPRPLSAAHHRLAMCTLAFDDQPQVQLDARETRRQGATYTLDTLRELQADLPGCDWFLVIGADQAQAFTTWSRWESILEIAIICVAERMSAALTALPYAFETRFPDRVRRLSMPAMAISSSDIRHRITSAQSIDTLVCPGVARYIADHHLYQSV